MLGNTGPLLLCSWFVLICNLPFRVGDRPLFQVRRLLRTEMIGIDDATDGALPRG